MLAAFHAHEEARLSEMRALLDALAAIRTVAELAAEIGPIVETSLIRTNASTDAFDEQIQQILMADIGATIWVN